ncbi:MAG: type IV secretion system DNA-binding domain-containing protein [Nitrospirae bacterium]|nr:type IV secretion system DNA-binding domain-containing protein [Nitrospirota bacterium]
MKKYEQYSQDDIAYVHETLIQPELPEQPLVLLRKEKEGDLYEACFKLELSGVTRKESDRQASDKSEAKDNDQTDTSQNVLLSGISSNQRIDFTYKTVRDEQRKMQVGLEITGYSKGETPAEAVGTLLRLWHNLSVTLGTKGDEYCFAPVIEPERLTEKEHTGVWVGIIRPAGIAIQTNQQPPVGFMQGRLLQKKTGVIVVPESENKKNRQFDAIVRGSAGNPYEITVKISISPLMLREDEVRKISIALDWLRNGEKKQISYHDYIEGGIEDEKVMTALQNSLSLWIKNPYGFRINCIAISEKPIPEAFLSLIGKEIFNNSPVTLTMQKIIHEADSHHRQHEEQEIFDLQDCVNSAALLPPLLPGVKALLDHGTKRLFRKAGWNISNEGILIGTVNTGTTEKDVRFSRSDRSRHCYIIGATGTGKSTLLYNMIRQDIENGDGVCVVDPHGDLYQQVIETIPKNRFNDVILIDPSDFENAVGINFLECQGRFKSVQMNFVTNEMIKVFDRLYDLRNTGGPIFEQYMRNALLLCMDNDIGATLMDIPMVFEDKKYRNFLKARCNSSVVVNFWTKQAEEAGGEASLNNMAPYITSKLNQFTTNALLRPIIGQLKSTIDFRKAMDERKILLVNLSKGLLGELDTQLLGMLIIGKVFSSSMGRILQRPEERYPFFLYVDEFQNFTTDAVAHLLSEARKFCIYLTLANQNLSQLSTGSGSKNILDAVLGNVGTTLILRIGAIDSQKMEIYTKPELLAQDLQDLPDFHVAGRILVKNTPSRPFVFETLLPEKRSNHKHIDKIIESSNRKYTTPVKKVEEDINSWRINYETLYSLRESVEDDFDNKMDTNYGDDSLLEKWSI